MRIHDDFFDEKPDWLQILVSIIVFISFLAIIGIGLFLAEQAFAYERLIDTVDESSGVSSSSTYFYSFTSAKSWHLYIDCEKAGISEIASTTIWAWNTTGSRTLRLIDANSKVKSVENYALSTTPKNYSYTFSPPIWCDDSTVALTNVVQSASAENRVGTMDSLNPTSGTDPVGWWVEANQSDNGVYPKQMIAIIAEGSYSTATPSTGGGTTTNNYYLEVSSSTPDGLNLIGGVSLVGLSLLFFLAGVISIVWLVRTFWR